MGKKKNPYLGKWRITEMELWDKEYIDLVAPGHFIFNKDGLGHFQFGTVEGEIDYRIEEVGGINRIEFSWEGQSEYDPVSGRGWASIDGEELVGRLYFHLGDDSWFKAKKLG